MATSDDPAIARRQLMAGLRGERARNGLTRDQAARKLDWSLSKLVRIESGHQGVSVTDLRALLGLYGVTDQGTLADYSELARASRRQAWWTGYREIISRPLGQYLEYEGAATRIDVFHPYLIPGLLHTADYAAAVLRGRKPDEMVRLLVDLRTERQDRLLRGNPPPRMSFIFGEEALARVIGGPAVMRQQLRHLLDLSRHPAVTIQVVPFSQGAHPGLAGSFILLDLPATGEDLVFLEGATGDLVSRDEADILSPFLDYYVELGEVACPEKDTAELIGRHLDQLTERVTRNGDGMHEPGAAKGASPGSALLARSRAPRRAGSG